MIAIIIAVLACWCLYNTLLIWHNERQDKRGEILDKSTVKILQIHCNRLDKLEERADVVEEFAGSINRQLHKHIDET